MTDYPNTLVHRLPRELRFTRVPAMLGDGDLLIAALDGACMAIAPPWTCLAAGESAQERAGWRLGRFTGTEEGVDLDAGADEIEGPLEFSDVWALATSAEDRAFLRGCQVTFLRHLVTVTGWLPADAAQEVEAELANHRAAWSTVFGDEPWPFVTRERAEMASAGLAGAGRQLSDLMQTAGSNLLAIFSSLGGEFAPQRGPTPSAVGEPKQDPRPGHIPFGPSIALDLDADSGTVVLTVDFSGLAASEPELIGQLAAVPLIVHVVQEHTDAILAAVRFQTTEGRQQRAVQLPPDALRNRLGVALEAERD